MMIINDQSLNKVTHNQFYLHKCLCPPPSSPASTPIFRGHPQNVVIKFIYYFWASLTPQDRVKLSVPPPLLKGENFLRSPFSMAKTLSSCDETTPKLFVPPPLFHFSMALTPPPPPSFRRGKFLPAPPPFRFVAPPRN